MINIITHWAGYIQQVFLFRERCGHWHVWEKGCFSGAAATRPSLVQTLEKQPSFHVMMWMARLLPASSLPLWFPTQRFSARLPGAQLWRVHWEPMELSRVGNCSCLLLKALSRKEAESIADMVLVFQCTLWKFKQFSLFTPYCGNKKLCCWRAEEEEGCWKRGGLLSRLQNSSPYLKWTAGSLAVMRPHTCLSH